MYRSEGVSSMKEVICALRSALNFGRLVLGDLTILFDEAERVALNNSVSVFNSIAKSEFFAPKDFKKEKSLFDLSSKEPIPSVHKHTHASAMEDFPLPFSE